MLDFISSLVVLLALFAVLLLLKIEILSSNLLHENLFLICAVT